jgi:hypothetical protein
MDTRPFFSPLRPSPLPSALSLPVARVGMKINAHLRDLLDGGARDTGEGADLVARPWSECTTTTPPSCLQGGGIRAADLAPLSQ